MSKKQLPTIGRIVHFHTADGGQVLPAIVTNVFAEGTVVNVTVFPDCNSTKHGFAVGSCQIGSAALSSVAMIGEDEPHPNAGAFCTWPPRA